MRLDLSDLPPKAREQAAIKLAIQEARRRQRQGNAPSSAHSGHLPPKGKALDAAADEPKKGNKLHAEKVQAFLADGTPFTFASKQEYDRYNDLLLMEKAGQITDLRVQVPFELIPAQERSDGTRERAVVYVADFVYQRDGKTVVEDSKGYRDPASATYRVFVLKRKMMQFLKGIEVQEV